MIVVDDEVRVASGLSCQMTLSSQKGDASTSTMQSCCCTKVPHTVLNSIMMLHEGFLCATEEHVDIEVINPLPADSDTPSLPSAMEFPGIASVLSPFCHWELRAQAQ